MQIQVLSQSLLHNRAIFLHGHANYCPPKNQHMKNLAWLCSSSKGSNELHFASIRPPKLQKSTRMIRNAPNHSWGTSNPELVKKDI